MAAPLPAKIESGRPVDTSIRVFRRYIRTYVNRDLSVPVVDATGSISKDCFMEWLGCRHIVPSEPEKTFQRALSAHLTGSDGRPFFSTCNFIPKNRPNNIFFLLLPCNNAGTCIANHTLSIFLLQKRTTFYS